MYKSLIRIRDVITDIRVQKIQDISEEDAKAEGVIKDHGVFHDSIQASIDNSTKRGFAVLWDSINAKRGYPWENNDGVWAITTKPLEG